jgi:peptide chain release factor subunit 1
MDTGMVSYGVRDTLRAWDIGALNTLVVWEDLDLRRMTLKCSEGQVYVKVLSPEVMKSRDYLLDPNSVEELTVVENVSFLEWVTDHYKEKGCKLELLGARSPEGVQFVDGFEGVMGFLRWKQNFAEQDKVEFEDEEDDDNEEEFM